MFAYQNSEELLKNIYEIIYILILSVTNSLIKGGEKMRKGGRYGEGKERHIRGSSN